MTHVSIPLLARTNHYQHYRGKENMKSPYGDKWYTHNFDQIPQKYLLIFVESQKYVDVESIKAFISEKKLWQRNYDKFWQM